MTMQDSALEAVGGGRAVAVHSEGCQCGAEQRSPAVRHNIAPHPRFHFPRRIKQKLGPTNRIQEWENEGLHARVLETVCVDEGECDSASFHFRVCMHACYYNRCA